MRGALLPERKEVADERDSSGGVGYGSTSPRISFSTDFAQVDKVSSPNRQGGADYSAEFEFCMSVEAPLSTGAPADEIFFNGKLLPLHLLPASRIEELLLEEGDSRTPSAGQSCKSSACPSPLTLHRQSSLPSQASPPSTPRAPACTGSWKELLGIRSSKFPRNGSNKRQSKLVRLMFKRASQDFIKSAGPSSEEWAERHKALDGTGRGASTPPPTSSSCGPGNSTSSVGGGGPQEQEDPETETSTALRDEDAEGDGSLTNDKEEGKPAPFPSTNQAARSKSRRGNSGKIMLRNLERCTRNCSVARSSSEQRSSQQQQEQGEERQQQEQRTQDLSAAEKQAPGSFSSSVRVTPILNVPICMDATVKENKSTITGLRKLLLSGRKRGSSFPRVSWACTGGAV